MVKIPLYIYLVCENLFLFVREFNSLSNGEAEFPNEFKTQNVKQISEKLLLLNVQEELPNPVCPTSLTTKCSHTPRLFIPSLQGIPGPYCSFPEMENYCEAKLSGSLKMGDESPSSLRILEI